jgi:hypothetical protein
VRDLTGATLSHRRPGCVAYPGWTYQPTLVGQPCGPARRAITTTDHGSIVPLPLTCQPAVATGVATALVGRPSGQIQVCRVLVLSQNTSLFPLLSKSPTVYACICELTTATEIAARPSVPAPG